MYGLAMLSVEVVVTFGDGNVVFMLQIAFFISCNQNLISHLNDLCIWVSSVLCCFIAAMESRIGEVRKVHVVYFLSRGGQVEHPHLIKVQLVALNGL